MASKHPYKVPKKMQTKFDEITALTDAFCEKHLSEEYAELARKMTAKLSRKRPSPLLKGWTKSWACGVVYALGQVNFLFDKSQPLHLEASELGEGFGVASSTGAGKAKLIREMLKINYFDHTWMLPSRIDSSSSVWMVMVNGLIVDIRNMPYEIQEIALEKGLIPYIPADK
ncbi:MAG: hypothetical protein MAG431_01877 [Chloroflexi bacterium]|nr:hypothetical protein [Chloroflexota bacterium]